MTISPRAMKRLSEIELRDLEEQIDNERMRRRGDKEASINGLLMIANGGETLSLKLGVMSRGRLDQLREMFGGKVVLSFLEDDDR